MKVIPLFKNETSLIARAVKNNPQAQQQLFEKYSGKMLSVCRIYIKDLHQAEEVMLTGFFKVFTYLSRFKGHGSFEGWIRKIMVREAISFLRSRKDLDFREELSQEKEERFNNVESKFNVEHIQQVIDELPEGYKVVFVMYAIEGYKHREIAEILHISEGTSKSQLYKARKMLQAQLVNQTTKAYVETKI